jgi:hypothetical protein
LGLRFLLGGFLGGLGLPGGRDGLDLFAFLGELGGFDTLTALRCGDIVPVLGDDWTRCDLLLFLFARASL